MTTTARPSAAEVRAWRDAMLREDAGKLVGLVRNYLGAVKTPFDKRDLLDSLETLLRRPGTGRATISMLDRMDALILGSMLFAGPISEPALKGLFAGEFPLADLGSKLANLSDRLLVYRQESSPVTLLAVTPFFVDALVPVVMDARLLFGPETGAAAEASAAEAVADSAAAGEAAERKASADATSVCLKSLALFAFLTDHPTALKKDGSLSARASASLHRICPDVDETFAAAVFGVLTSSGLVEGGRDEGRIDVDALDRIFRKGWEALPWRLAVARSGNSPAAAAVVSEILKPFFENSFRFSRQGLARLLRISCWKNGYAQDDPALVGALIELGMIEDVAGVLRCRPEALVSHVSQSESARTAAQEEAPKAGGPILAAEGSGTLHLMPEASLPDRLFLISTARPVRLSGLWDFELDARSARRAFARGSDAASTIARLETMCGGELPQTLSFSLASWEEEYRKLRLFRGSFLAVDEPTADILEASGIAASLGAEKVASGMYFLGNTLHERIEEALASIGMEMPPAIRTAKAPIPDGSVAGGGRSGDGPQTVWYEGPTESEALRNRPRTTQIAGAKAPIFGDGGTTAPAGGATLQSPDSGEKVAAGLKSVLSGFTISPALRSDIEERIVRRLVLDENQLDLLAGVRGHQKSSGGGSRELSGQARAGKRPAPILRDQVAGAMDYQGKLRLIRQALKSTLDRLEVQWSPVEGERRTSTLRPTGLEQNEKGHVLEAEDLGAGGPVRIKVGAMSSVRLMRASYFGDDT